MSFELSAQNSTLFNYSCPNYLPYHFRQLDVMVEKNNLHRCKYMNFHRTEQALIVVTVICFGYFPNISPVLYIIA